MQHVISSGETGYLGCIPRAKYADERLTDFSSPLVNALYAKVDYAV